MRTRTDRRRRRFVRNVRRVIPSVARDLLFKLFVIGLAVVQAASAQSARTLPDSLTGREFWQLFTSASEDGGTFASENFVSNEKTYQYVIPTLRNALTPGGVYLGVGPEQNF